MRKNCFLFLIFLIFRTFNTCNSSKGTEKAKASNNSRTITYLLLVNESQSINHSTQVNEISTIFNLTKNTSQSNNKSLSFLPTTLQNYIKVYFFEHDSENKEPYNSSYEESFVLERYFSIQSLIIGNMFVIIVLLMTIKSCRNIKQNSGNNLNLFNMHEY